MSETRVSDARLAEIISGIDGLTAEDCADSAEIESMARELDRMRDVVREMTEIVRKLRERGESQHDFLKFNHPKVFFEQEHLDEDAIERAYWRYGSQSALRDAIVLMSPVLARAKGDKGGTNAD